MPEIELVKNPISGQFEKLVVGIWELEFFERNLRNLLRILEASNFLEIPGLYNMTSQFLADQLTKRPTETAAKEFIQLQVNKKKAIVWGKKTWIIFFEKLLKRFTCNSKRTTRNVQLETVQLETCNSKLDQDFQNY